MAVERQNDVDFNHRLQECSELIDAAELELSFYMTQATNDDYPMYFGSGKIDEFDEKRQEEGIETVICLDELSPSQHRNLEERFNCEVLDRTQLILVIFGRRAQSREAKLQAESARLSYLLPRLKTQRSHVGRQQGGAAKTRGAGETLVDLRRRVATKQFQTIQRELKRLEFVHETQSLARRKSSTIVCAFVGYTNVGKSSLMNALLERLNHSHDKSVVANDRLFETLSTASRSTQLTGKEIILTDTVGFIRKLPHHLVESFKSTLDEVREADLLLHVVDISHSNFEEQVNVVNETLKEMNALDKPTIMVFNKIDAFTYDKKDEDDLTPATKENYSLEDLKKMWMSKNTHPTVYISAAKKINTDELKDVLYKHIKKTHLEIYPNMLLY